MPAAVALIKATPAKLEYAICYDLNKMYAAMLMHSKFTVPMQEGKFATISQQEVDAMAFFKYGIYKCRITNPNQVSTRLFQHSESKSYHTHFSLTTQLILVISFFFFLKPSQY